MSLVWYKVLPADFGGQKGIANFNEALGKRFSLLCVCSNNNDPASAKNYQVFNWLPVSKKQVIDPFIWWKILHFAKQQNISHVVLEHPYHGISGWFLQVFLKCYLITHSHNIEFARFRQLAKWYWRPIKWLEGFTYRLSKEVLFKTEQDMEQAIRAFKLKRQNCIVVPYGVEKKDTSQKEQARAIIIQAHNIPATNKILLFTASPDYEPNAIAVTNIVHHLIPLLPQNYTVIITGGNPMPIDNRSLFAQHSQVVLAGFVEEVNEYFLAADGYINPVNKGGGVQTKTLEALSYNLNVVCWKDMLNGISSDLTGNKIHTAKPGDWKDFMARVLVATIINDDTPNDFFEYYSFDHHIEKLAERIENQNA